MDGHSYREPDNLNRSSEPAKTPGSKDHIERLALAGLASTAVMTVFAYYMPMIGMTRADYAQRFGSRMTGEKAQPGSKSWLLGLAAHFIDGSAAFPAAYSRLLRPRLTGAPWLRGMQCGAGLFVVSQAVAAPLLGSGFFSSRAPERPKAILTELISHLVYGCMLGALAGERADIHPD